MTDTVPHPDAIYVVGGQHAKKRHYPAVTKFAGGTTALCFWWAVVPGRIGVVYDLPVCGRCAAMHPRG